MMVTNSVLAAATASMLLLTSPFVAVHAQDPQGTCEQDSDHCGEWSVARAIQNGNTALGGYCSVGGGADNSAGKMETQLRDYAVVGGGDTNTAAAQKSVIAVRTAVPSYHHRVSVPHHRVFFFVFASFCLDASFLENVISPRSHTIALRPISC